MKRQTLQSILLLAASLMGMAASPASQAATWSGTWNYSNCGDTSASTVSWGNSYTCTDSSLPADAKMNISGWSSDLSPATNFAAAAVYPWGSSAGFGVVNRDECAVGATTVCDPGTGPHATDGVDNLDGFLMKFSNNPSDIVKVALESVQIGWNGSDDKGITTSTKGNACSGYCDSDISVYYYTGSSDPTMGAVSAASLKGATTTTAVNGWKLLGHYADVGLMTSNTVTLGNTGAGAVSSSWWLVTTSNSSAGDSNADAFKLLTVAGTGDTTKRTPEPGSLALAGLALFGMVSLRRKAKQQA